MGPFFRVVFNFVVGGALLGLLAVTYAYPKYKSWDNTPSFGTALCECAETVRQTASGLINAQMMGCVSGAGAGLVAGLVFFWTRRKRRKEAAPPPSTATPAAPTAPRT